MIYTETILLNGFCTPTQFSNDTLGDCRCGLVTDGSSGRTLTGLKDPLHYTTKNSLQVCETIRKGFPILNQREGNSPDPDL